MDSDSKLGLRSYSLDELSALVADPTTAFQWARTINFNTPNVREVYERYCVHGGMPLVLEKTLDGWDTGQNGEFNWARLPELMGADATLTLRNNLTFEDVEMTYTEYAAYLARCAPGADVTHEPLFYGKDLPAPKVWSDATHRNLPAHFHEKRGGDTLECVERPEFASETLMTYIGVNGTHTCGHYDICASLGHNLLLDSDEGATSIWFIVRSQDHAAANQFWLRKGGSLYSDNCFLDANTLKLAPFPIFVVFQRKGDFVLVPPMAAHEVFNKGRNVKISWNRLPPRSLELAYFQVLPNYRLVARPETYPVVGLAYYSLVHWTKLLQEALQSDDTARVRLLADDLGAMIRVMTDFIGQQEINYDDPLFKLDDEADEDDGGAAYKRVPPQREMQPVPAEDLCSCDICHAALFCRFVQCTVCEKDRDYCLRCAASLRGCKAHALRIVELMPLHRLMVVNDKAYDAVREAEARGWTSVFVTPPNYVLKPKTQRSDATIVALLICNQLRNSSTECHQCKSLSPDRHGAQCHVCNVRYCHDCVYHRYSDSFHAVLQDATWDCYRCRSKCNCPFCRQRRRFQPHDMFHVRAIECVNEELLGEEDWNPPRMLIKGIGVDKFNVRDDFLAPARVFPRDRAIEQLDRFTLLVARNRGGVMWPCVRATAAEEMGDCDFGQKQELLVRFFNLPIEDTIGWVSTRNLCSIGDREMLKDHIPANEALAAAFREALKEYDTFAKEGEDANADSHADEASPAPSARRPAAHARRLVPPPPAAAVAAVAVSEGGVAKRARKKTAKQIVADEEKDRLSGKRQRLQSPEAPTTPDRVTGRRRTIDAPASAMTLAPANTAAGTKSMSLSDSKVLEPAFFVDKLRSRKVKLFAEVSSKTVRSPPSPPTAKKMRNRANAKDAIPPAPVTPAPVAPVQQPPAKKQANSSTTKKKQASPTTAKKAATPASSAKKKKSKLGPSIREKLMYRPDAEAYENESDDGIDDEADGDYR